MRVLDGDQFLVRIFLGEPDKWHHTPLPGALLERLRREGFAGATVIHGVAGFGASRVIHTANLVELSADLPVLIEVVDDEAHDLLLLAAARIRSLRSDTSPNLSPTLIASPDRRRRPRWRRGPARRHRSRVNNKGHEA